MHDCRCTWEASNSNDITSFDRAMDFLEVLFCLSERRGEERERSQSHTDTHYTYMYTYIVVHIPCICHDLNFNPFPSQIVEDELPSTLPL